MKKLFTLALALLASISLTWAADPTYKSSWSDLTRVGETDYYYTYLTSTDYAPFRKGIEAGADFVMVGHIIMKNVSQEEVPASVSSYFMTDILKNEWGYDGIIITDDISMAAISNRFSPADAAVAAINAGADMIYTTSDFDEAYQGIVDGVNQGVISSDRIDESIRRILRIKYMKQFNG